MFHEVWEIEGFQTAKVTFRVKSFKGIDNGAIRQAIYDFLLVFHCNCAEIWHKKIIISGISYGVVCV